MASQGPRFANVSADDNTAATGDADGGTYDWNTPANAKVDDGNTSVCNFTTADQSHYLKWTDFGFTLPPGATVDGIVVEIKYRDSSGTSVTTARARIVKGGTKSSTWKTGAAWPSSLAYATFGNAADKWGETWLWSDINSSGFGFAIMADANPAGSVGEIDAVRLTVHYTGGVSAAGRKLLLGVG